MMYPEAKKTPSNNSKSHLLPLGEFPFSLSGNILTSLLEEVPLFDAGGEANMIHLTGKQRMNLEQKDGFKMFRNLGHSVFNTSLIINNSSKVFPEFRID